MSSVKAYLAMCDSVHTTVTTTSGRDFAVACAYAGDRPDVALSLDYGAEVSGSSGPRRKNKGGSAASAAGLTEHVRKRRLVDPDFDAAYRKQRQELGWRQTDDEDVIGHLTIAERASPIRFITHPSLRSSSESHAPQPKRFATYAVNWRATAKSRTLGKTSFDKMIRTKSLEHIGPLSDCTFVSFKKGPAYPT